MPIGVSLWKLCIKAWKYKQSLIRSCEEDEYIHESMFYDTIRQVNICIACDMMMPFQFTKWVAQSAMLFLRVILWSFCDNPNYTLNSIHFFNESYERAAWNQISLLLKLAIHCCLPSTACMRDVWKTSLLYTCLYSIHSYWWKRQVYHQMWPLGSPHESKQVCRQVNHPGFETHGEEHTKSKIGAISGPAKWTLVQEIFF